MNNIAVEGELCSLCRSGQLNAGEGSFSVDEDGRVMLIGHVPALVCTACGNEHFSETIRNDLIKKTKEVFAKSSSSMFFFQYSDFVRPSETAADFEMFDRVRVKDDVNTWDLYDEDLEAGMEGSVIGRGEKPFDWIVEFRIGKGRSNVLEVEIDADDLELVHRFSEPKVKPKKEATRSRT